MKTKSIFITAIALMVIVPTASAQKQIKKAFKEIEEYHVTKIGEQKTAKVDANGITIESNVTTIKVKGRGTQHAVFEILKKAFKNESGNSYMYEDETGNEKNEIDSIDSIDSARFHDLGMRRQWSIWRDGAEAVLIGGMKNSSYFIANFDDKKHDGYRTCYAAEWSNADNPDVYTAKLVYVYGRSPIQPLPINGMELSTNNIGNILSQFHGTIPDSLFIDSLFIGNSWNKGIRAFTLNIGRENIPFDGNMDKWMALAMQRGVTNLSDTDWHRFFGLLTQKMIDKANKESKEDLVVAAGIILDLCKNASLDDDERRVVTNRLCQVINCFDSDKYEYIRDMLTLAARKVAKE